MPTKLLTIGELAKASATNVVTIRYYEKCDLLPIVERTEGGHRLYTNETLRYLQFIQHAKQVGFNLGDTRELLKLKMANKGTGQKVKKLTLEKIQLIDDKITALQHMKHTLNELANSCNGKMPVADCPILTALSAEKPSIKKSKKSLPCCKHT